MLAIGKLLMKIRNTRDALSIGRLASVYIRDRERHGNAALQTRTQWQENKESN